ncbi:hypothetical protein JDW19_02530 [Paenibacillus polymyxa]|uniref:Uncharacterized protein n=1 Tax=Paenibacillus polymyxa TaxID=1406 RepID=A0A8I1LPH0_PAEPO|nr:MULTISPECIES: hypothetical protein [Paenibacillus]KAF6576550.1 hypothetical protein G9G53_01165 [Paenibacillus sp. EKM206P]KAF6591316.1 hypothetical protein G9G52_02800 [Paenibacillus sp. EKM205P]MBM0632005.1 hypothetical protein [Paenibacillus polymyxa]
MEKAILTKAQAQSIESKIKNFPRERVIRDFVTTTKENGSKDGITLDMLNQAIYIGYEVEQTIEEKLLEIYREGLPYQAPPDVKSAFREGMKKACEIAGIKVKWARN